MATSGGGGSDTCSICLNKYNQPKILQCFHTFCCECLKTLFSKSENNEKFYCPTCRYEVTLPDGGVDKFQTNFYIEARAERTAHKDDASCDVCDQKASHACHECDFLLCDSCVKHHRVIPTTRSHSLIQLADQPDGKAFISRQAFCEKHGDKKVKFYCRPCDKVICSHCKLTSHEGHKTLDISDVVSTARTSLAETKVKLEKFVPRIASSLQKIKDNSLLTTSLLDGVGTQINKTVDDLIEKINAVRSDGLEKVKEVRKTTDNSITDAVNVVQLRHEFLQRQIDHIAELLTEGLDCDVMAADGEMKKRLTEVETMDSSDAFSQNAPPRVTSSVQCLDAVSCNVSDVITGLVSQISDFQLEVPVINQFSCGNGKIRTIDTIKSKGERIQVIVGANHVDSKKEVEYFCYVYHYPSRTLRGQISIPPKRFDNDDTFTICEAIATKEDGWDYKIEKFPEVVPSSHTDKTSSNNSSNHDNTAVSDNTADSDNTTDSDNTADSDDYFKTFKKQYLYSDMTGNGDTCWVDRDNELVIVKLENGDARLLNVNPFAKPGESFKPLDVCWGNQGELYVVDSGSNTILVYSMKSGFQKTITLPGNSFLPSAVNFDIFGNLWIGQMNGEVCLCPVD